MSKCILCGVEVKAQGAMCNSCLEALNVRNLIAYYLALNQLREEERLRQLISQNPFLY